MSEQPAREHGNRIRLPRLRPVHWALNLSDGLAADISDYTAPQREPTHVTYRGLDVYGMAPPSSGGSTPSARNTAAGSSTHSARTSGCSVSRCTVSSSGPTRT